MRNAFFRALHRQFVEDDRVYFITGDLGFKLYDELTAHDPERVINAGIREAAIAGMSAGLAKEGMRPFIYSITPFITLRCVEQIKIDICYHNLNVVVVGVGGGFAYGPNGPTHHGVDDLGLMRLLPNMTIFSPADPDEVELCVEACATLGGPAYIRLGRNGEPRIFERAAKTDISKPQVVSGGQDMTIVATGPVLAAALKAAESLKAKNIRCRVVKLSRLKPIDEIALMETILPGRPVLSVEEHIGGASLALPLSDILLRNGNCPAFGKLCIPDAFPHECMSHRKLLEWSGLDEASIAAECERLVRGG